MALAQFQNIWPLNAPSTFTRYGNIHSYDQNYYLSIYNTKTTYRRENPKGRRYQRKRSPSQIKPHTRLAINQPQFFVNCPAEHGNGFLFVPYYHYHSMLYGNDLPLWVSLDYLGEGGVLKDSIIGIVSHSARMRPIDVCQSEENAFYPDILSSTKRRFTNFTLHRDYELMLPYDSFDSVSVSETKEQKSISGQFRTFLEELPPFVQDIVRSADPEGLVRRLLPSDLIPCGARHVATCFWAWLCVIDDLTEKCDSLNDLEKCIEALSSSPYAPPVQDNSDCMRVMGAFHRLVSNSTLDSVDNMSSTPVVQSWKSHFWREILAIVKALQAEKCLQGWEFSMREWMEARMLTISARPFMVLVRASLALSCNLDYGTDRTVDLQIHQIQTLVQAVLGLQNDLLGWEKDHRTDNPLNAVEVLIRNGVPASDAFREVLESHNYLVRVLLQVARQASLFSADMHGVSFAQDGNYLYAVLANILITVGFAGAMAEWMLSSQRYKT